MAARVDNPIETLVGAAVLAVAIGFAVYASAPRESGGSEGSYELYALFSNATGVSPGTDVRIAGVKVGRVSEVAFDTATKQARVTIEVRDDVSLGDETMAIIDSEGLLGGTFVALDPIPGFGDLQPGDQIVSTQGAISLVGIVSQFATSSSSSGSGEEAGTDAE